MPCPRFPFFALLACLSFSIAHTQYPADQRRAILLKRMIERHHYSPRVVNDSCSAHIFSGVVNTLDPQHRLFTTGDYNRLAQYRYRLDDELNGAEWSFTHLATDLYRQALKRRDSLIGAVLQQPLRLDGTEAITLQSGSGATYAASVNELRQRWTQWLRLQLLYHAYTLRSAQPAPAPLKEVIAKNEPLLRQKIKNVAGLHNSPSDAELAARVREAYFTAFATAFDPHSLYFSPHDRESFQSALSKEQASYGFTVGDKEGKVVIQQLLPGGPAWKSGALHRNDQLLQLRFGQSDPHDITVLTAEEVEALFARPDPAMVVRVKKANGLVKEVALQKEKLETEENSVKSYVLQGPRKIGYISLPDFYSNWEGGTGSGCAADMAKAIVHLKKENIDGLILDVRYNGGGSLDEALQLIGIFIDEGPLLGTLDRKGKLGFLKDPNRGTIYDGPLLLLVNGQSASASEALAATLQDYHRAVIAGSTTYGKATMQGIYPMDTTTANMHLSSPNGWVKITTGKLYRLSGQTAQLHGVQPDLPLPDLFDGLAYREKFSPGALPADSVQRNAYYKPLAPLPVKALQAESARRLAAHKGFNEVKAAARLYADIAAAQQQVIPLQPDAFEKWMAQHQDPAAHLEEKNGPSTLFTVANHGFDRERLQHDGYGSALNSVVMNNIRQDMYIEEAVRILCDLINLKP